jgi:hypothetical protein
MSESSFRLAIVASCVPLRRNSADADPWQPCRTFIIAKMSYPSIDYFRTIASPCWPSVTSTMTPLQLGHQLFRDQHGPQRTGLSNRLAGIRKRLSAARTFGHWKNGKHGSYEVLHNFDRLEERLHALVFGEEMWLKAQQAQEVGEAGMEVKSENTWRGLEMVRSLSLKRILSWRSE